MRVCTAGWHDEEGRRVFAVWPTPWGRRIAAELPQQQSFVVFGPVVLTEIAAANTLVQGLLVRVTVLTNFAVLLRPWTFSRPLLPSGAGISAL